MIDDWWLMSDEWWLMIDDKINTNIIWNGPHIVCPRGDPPGVIYILHFILYLYLFYHQSSIITHHSSIISHQSSVINHQLSIINHPWSMINHQSLITSHQFSADTLWAIFCRHSVISFFLTCMQRLGNRLGTFGHHWRPSGRIGKRREHSVNPR